VSAVIAIRRSPDLVQVRVVLADGGPLPGVFAAVGEEDVGALGGEGGVGVVAALVVHGCIYFWEGEGGHVEAGEDAFAHAGPVGHVEHGGAHRVLDGGYLEPPVFSAVLVGPGTGRGEGVDGVSVVEGRVVVWGVDTGDVLSKVGHVVENLLISSISCLTIKQHLTQSSPVSILDSLNLNISIVKREIIRPHSLSYRSGQESVDNVVGIAFVSEGGLFGNVVVGGGDHGGAEISTLEGGGVDLVVELPEVRNRLHHTRRCPTSNSHVWIPTPEPA